MKKPYYIVLLLLIALFACTQKKGASKSDTISEDSLSNYLSKANDFNSPQKKRQEYIQKAFAIIIDQPNDSMNRVNLFRVANRYYNINNWNEYKKTVQLVLEKSKISKDTINTAKAYTYLGDYYGTQGVSDSAYMYFFKGEILYSNLKDNYNAARTRLNIALLQFNESDFLGSEISVFKALRVIKGEKTNQPAP